MKKEEFTKMELVMIRDELLTMKKCQHNLLIFEIAAVGSLLGLVVPLLFQEKIEFQYSFIALVALIVIFPCLYIILDKGISINRIAAFFHVFEHYVLVKSDLPPRFKGWEDGCLRFRKRHFELEVSPEGPEGSGTQGPNKFYILVFSISTILALACYVVWFSLYNNYLNFKGINCWTPDPVFIMAVVFLLIVGFVIRTSMHLRKLLKGIHTIKAMSKLWWKIIAKEGEPYPE